MPVANGKTKTCIICKNNFYISKYRMKSAAFCSSECLFKFRAIRKNKCTNGEPILCEKHGLHTNWRYKKSNSNTICRFCLNETNLKYYRDPKRKIKKLLNFARHRAKKHNRDFDLDETFIRSLIEDQSNKCALSGIEFIDNHKIFEMSIDRIDSDLGYTRDNVQLVCIIVNRIKMDHSQDLIIDICKRIAEKQNGRA